MKTIYVGNLPFTATEEEIKDFFSQHGEVYSVKMITDRNTGRSRGYGFVEMDDDVAAKVIEETNGVDYNGRDLRVNIARERSERGARY